MSGFGGRALRAAVQLVPQDAVLPFTRPAAVFFHGVETAGDDPALQNTHHDRNTFIAIVRALKARFDVLPLAALGDVLKDPDKHARAVFLMADDGYAGTLDAADILEDFALPWTLFVATQHIGAQERNPMFRARAFLRYAPLGCYELPHIGRIDFITSARDAQEPRIIAELKCLDADKAHETLRAMDAVLAEAGLADLPALFPSDSFLSWEDVRKLAARGVTIGAQAHWQWPMNGHQSHDYLVEQALLPKGLIEAQIDSPCVAFAYPFGNTGDVSRQAWQAVRDAGYNYAFTTLSGSLDASTNRFLLPRHGMGLNETNIATTVALLRAGNRRLQRFQHQLREAD